MCSGTFLPARMFRARDVGDDEIQRLHRDHRDDVLVLLAFRDVARRHDDHAQDPESGLDHDLIRRRVVRVIRVRLSHHLVGGAEHESGLLRHQRDRDVEEQVALPQVVLRCGLPIEPVVLVFGHSKDSAPCESFKS
jgi:hypothetical protein